LLYTRDPIASGAAPSGLTAILSNRQVVLSWWGTAYATSYNVKRGTASGGPYTTIATGISDLLTYTDSTPGPETYYYVVTAVTPIGETATSNEATASTGLRLHTLLTFDEGSGTNAADATGNGHTGTLVNGVSWAAGRKGNAVVLNGTDGYVSLPAGLLANLGDCTIAAWVYWNGGQTWSRIFDFGKDTSFNMFLTPAAYGAGMRFVITTIGQPGEQRINSAVTLPSKQWVHVAVSLAGSVGTLYVNGSAVGTNTAMSFLPFRLGNTTNNWIGRSQYSGDAYFNGIIDDFRIYNGAMNDDDLMGLIDVVA
jgi:hypothetical protein